MRSVTESEKLLKHNKNYIPGGVVSVNRATQPEIAFARGEGSKIWDVDGNEYIDYHAAFGPHFLGHNDPYVTEAVVEVLRAGASLFGSGTTALEGRLAELICKNVPVVDSVQFLNSGSEATYQAIRLARAVTGLDHIIKIQGGYNGWHNDVSCNLMTPLNEIGARVSPGEYPFKSISAGIPEEHQRLVLQNIGIVKPDAGYLSGLRALADEFGFVLIFDEVKTGFRHAIGGFASIAGVKPDLVVYGKALANGYPIAVIGGRQDMMIRFIDPLASRRVLLAGTYNAHPVPTAAAIATIERLLMNNGEIHRHVETLGDVIERGLEEIVRRLGVMAVVARQGSAFCLYFMDHLPCDWHDIATHHDFDLDTKFRRVLVDLGIYVFPLATKQCSISAAHSRSDIDVTLVQVEGALALALEQQQGAFAKSFVGR
jgi:glutamate-1-semialdehyde 2,1-aminomutase